MFLPGFGTDPTCRPAARAALGPAADPHPSDRDFPTLVEIQSGRARTLRHVPVAARYLWGRVLSQALAAAVHHNDLKAWTELLMLPQCVLEAPPRGGCRHRRAAAAYTVDRLQRRAAGERRSLWDDRTPPPALPTRALDAEQKRSLAIVWPVRGSTARPAMPSSPPASARILLPL